MPLQNRGPASIQRVRQPQCTCTPWIRRVGMQAHKQEEVAHPPKQAAPCDLHALSHCVPGHLQATWHACMVSSCWTCA